MQFFQRDRTPLQIVAYAIYLYLSSLSLRKAAEAVGIFSERSHEAVRQWLHRFSNLMEALHTGPARVAVVDETAVRVAGEQAWLWIAMDPKSRRLLAVRLTWTRNIQVAEGFLRLLKRRHGVRVIVADGSHWYPPACRALGLRLHVRRGGVHSLLERLNKEVKWRLKDFDISFPSRSGLGGARFWLKAWKAYYNHVCRHTTLRAAPSVYAKLEPHQMLAMLEGLI